MTKRVKYGFHKGQLEQILYINSSKVKVMKNKMPKVARTKCKWSI